VTIPGRFLLEITRNRVWRIATYLEIFVEPKLGDIKRQRRLNERLNACGTVAGSGTNIITIGFFLILGLDLLAGALVIATIFGVQVTGNTGFAGS
jgi:hypothetical protein